jgi:glycosyltransferase involved in cell wall biosynthesis
MTLKIMHVMAGGTVGGAENIFLEDVLALADCLDITQHIVTRNEPHRIAALTEKNIPFTLCSFAKYWPFPTRKAIRRAIAEFKPDIIQYWMGRAGEFSVVGSHINVAWYGGYYNRQKRFKNCTHHIVLTRDLRRHVLESGVDEKDISIIHTMASVPNDIVAQDRVALDTPQDAIVLLALARLHWKKGLDVLLYALRELPHCIAWIAGDGPLKKELYDLAQALGVLHQVRFLGWRNDRWSLLKAADICVFPSRYEPFGTVMVDAWAMRVPLIAADAQGPAAYMRQGENGLLIPKDDSQALVDAVNYLCENKNLCEHVITGGWQDFQTYFTKEAFIKDSLTAYKAMVTK